MEQLWAALRYFGEHPDVGLTAVMVLLVVYYFLNRKSRLTREADERLKQLRKERGDYYRTIRPPR